MSVMCTEYLTILRLSILGFDLNSLDCEPPEEISSPDALKILLHRHNTDLDNYIIMHNLYVMGMAVTQLRDLWVVDIVEATRTWNRHSDIKWIDQATQLVNLQSLKYRYVDFSSDKHKIATDTIEEWG